MNCGPGASQRGVSPLSPPTPSSVSTDFQQEDLGTSEKRLESCLPTQLQTDFYQNEVLPGGGRMWRNRCLQRRMKLALQFQGKVDRCGEWGLQLVSPLSPELVLSLGERDCG